MRHVSKNRKSLRSQTPWLAAALSAASVAAPSAAEAMGGDFGYGGPICVTTVNLENCQTYLASDGYCESLVKDQCQTLVAQAHADERARITTTKVVIPGGNPVSMTTKVAKFIPGSRADQYLDGADAMYVANNLSLDLATAKGESASRIDAALNSECTQEANAAGQLTKVCTCGQYAYDTYYSARPFEQQVANTQQDYRALFQGASSVLGSQVLSKDSLFQTTMLARTQSRTAFHAINTWVLESQYPDGAVKHVWDNPLRMAFANTGKSYTLTRDQHAALASALASVPDQTMNNLFDEQEKFTSLLRARQERFKAFEASVKGHAKTSAKYIDEANAAGPELKSLDEQLEAGMRRAKDVLGCVPAAIGNVTACDWSPKLFYRDAQKALSGLSETRYQKCVQLTGDDFDNTPASALQNSMVFANHLVAEANTPKPLGKVSVEGGLPMVGQEFSDSSQYGNSDFNVGYNYHFSWGLTDFDKTDAGGNRQLCKANVKGGGVFNVDGTVFGHTKNVVDFDAYAYTKTHVDNGVESDKIHAEISTKILGMELFNPINDSKPARYDWVSTPRKEFGDKAIIKKTFPVAFVPVTVTAGIVGSFGVDVELHAGLIRDCVGTPDQLDIGVDTKVKPWADVDGHLSAGIGWSGLSAGIKGQVTLVEAELPFAAKAGLQFLPGNSGSNLYLVAKTDAKLKLKTMDGKVSAYVEYIFDETEREIFSFPGYELSTTIFDFDAKYPVAQVVNWVAPPQG